MLKIERVVEPNGSIVEQVIRGMRNPMNSWLQSDSDFVNFYGEKDDEPSRIFYVDEYVKYFCGPKDTSLMQSLAHAGSSHRKFMRMIPVYCDVTAPLYWWKEMDTYRMGVEKNSCSTMHRIHAKAFELDDFSHDMLSPESLGALQATVDFLNTQRERYLENKDKRDWYQLIQLLPSSYNQMRTMMFSYEALSKIWHERKDHKLNEWHTFCRWIETLPLAKEIICI